ncbi:hypothetical protein D3C85_1642060 [compost metagenome]
MQGLLDQSAELLGIPWVTHLQAIVDQLQPVLVLQQALGHAVGLQHLAILVEDDGAHSQLVHRTGVEVTLGLDAV